MIAGRSVFGKLLFDDASINLHKIEYTVNGLVSRWTLQFTFKALPWKPCCYFTGVSVYTLDEDFRTIVKQLDYWDR